MSLNFALNIVIKELWDQLKGKIVEKLAPPPEESEDSIKLQKIQEILLGIAPRYYGYMQVSEMYDPINEVLGVRRRSEDSFDSYLDIRKGGSHIPTFVVEHVNRILGHEWIQPDIAAAFHLYYNKNLTDTGKFRRVHPWHAAQKDDIAFFDGRRNFGDGAMAIVVDDYGHELKCYTHDSTKYGLEAWSKTGLIGYMRPTDPKVG